MFKRLLHSDDYPIEIRFEARTIRARDGETVAAALLAAGEIVLRETGTPGDGRGPYCMIGNCFECRVEIDGRPNQQACMQRVRNGMRVRRQRGPRTAESDDAA